MKHAINFMIAIGIFFICTIGIFVFNYIADYTLEIAPVSALVGMVLFAFGAIYITVETIRGA